MTELSPPLAPLPPAAPTAILASGLAVVRFYHPKHGDGRSHRFFGPLSEMRFDHHPPPCRRHENHSVWYSAASLRGAVAEAFGRHGFVDRTAGYRIVKAVIQHEIPVLDFLGLAPRALQLTQEIAASTDYPTTQSWARAIYQSYRNIQGVRWRGRQSGSMCILLHDRANMAQLEAESWSVNDPIVWPRIARAARECRMKIV